MEETRLLTGKFEQSIFWKHARSIDAFLCLHYVYIDDGKVATLIAEWLCQGAEHYWTLPIPEHKDRSTILRIEINAENYDQWRPYVPQGSYLSPGEYPS